MSNITFVYTYLPSAGDFVLCGKLEMSIERRNPWATFSYVSSYLKRNDAYQIDPELILNDKEHTTRSDFSCFGAIRDASPDGWGRHILNRLNQIAEMSEFEYIVQSGADRVGALAFSPNPYGVKRINAAGEEINVLGESFSIDDLLHVVSMGLNNDSLPEHMRRFFLRGSSAMGGARPKGSTLIDNQLWLAKFSRNDDGYNQPLIEYANMSMAKLAGLNVPEIKFIKVGNDENGVFLIKRFDRNIVDNKIEKNPFLSALSFIGAHESDHGIWGYGDICKVIDKASTTSKNEKIELYKRMVFNVISCNNDDHLRNHGFLYDYDAKEWKLSPLYDVVPDVSLVSKNNKYLYLKLTGQDRSATLNNAIKAHKEFGITLSDAKDIVHNMINLTLNWKDIYKSAGVSDYDIESLNNAFSEVSEYHRSDLLL